MADSRFSATSDAPAGQPGMSAPHSSMVAGDLAAIDPAALQMPSGDFSDFASLSAEQFDLLVKNALAADPLTLTAQANAAMASSSSDPSGMLLPPINDSLAGLPTGFDFGAQGLAPGLLDPTLLPPQSVLMPEQPLQHPSQHQDHQSQTYSLSQSSAGLDSQQSGMQIAGPSAPSACTNISATGLSSQSSTLMGPDTLSQQHLAGMATSPLNIDQAATAAGWQVFGTQLPSTTPTFPPPAAFPPVLLHMPPQPVQGQHQGLSMQHIPHTSSHSLQGLQLQHAFQAGQTFQASSGPQAQHQLHQSTLQQQQQSQQSQSTAPLPPPQPFSLHQSQALVHPQHQPMSTLPNLQHHHSFHHLPSTHGHDPLFGSTLPNSLASIDANQSGFQDHLSGIDHQLHSHQSLPHLPMHYQPVSGPVHPQFQRHPSALFMSDTHSTLQPHTPASSVISAGSAATTGIVGAPGYASGSSGASSSVAGSGLSMGGAGGLLSPASVASMPNMHTHHHAITPQLQQHPHGHSQPSLPPAPAQPMLPHSSSSSSLQPPPLPQSSSSSKTHSSSSGSAVRSRPKRSVSAGMPAGAGHGRSMSVSTAAAASLLGGSRLLAAAGGSGSGGGGSGAAGAGSSSVSSSSTSLSQPLRDILASSKGRALLEEAARVRNERVQKYDEVSAALDTLRLYFKQSSRRSQGGGSSSSSGGGSSLSGRRANSSIASGPGNGDLSLPSSSRAGSISATSSGRGPTPSASHIVGLGLGMSSSSTAAHPPAHHRNTRNVSGSTAANTSGASSSTRAGIGNSSVISALSSGTMASTSSTNASSVRSDNSRQSYAPSASSNLNVAGAASAGVVGPGSGTSSITGSPVRSHGHSRTRSRRASSSLHRSFSGEVVSTLSDPAPAGQPYPSPYAHLHGHAKPHGYLHGHPHRSTTGVLSSPGSGSSGSVPPPPPTLTHAPVPEDDNMSDSGDYDDDQRLNVLDDISERVSRMREEVQMALAEAAAAAAAEDSAALASLMGEGPSGGAAHDGTAGHDLVEPPG